MGPLEQREDHRRRDHAQQGAVVDGRGGEGNIPAKLMSEQCRIHRGGCARGQDQGGAGQRRKAEDFRQPKSKHGSKQQAGAQRGEQRRAERRGLGLGHLHAERDQGKADQTGREQVAPAATARSIRVT